MISELHKILTQTTPTAKPAYIREWERDLEQEFSENQLTQIYQLTHTSSIDSKTQENNYKILAQWYRVPAALAKIFPSVSNLCWWGCGHRGTLLHIWWECPVIQGFWSDVKNQIRQALGIDLPMSPIHFLLHVPTVRSANTERALYHIS